MKSRLPMFLIGYDYIKPSFQAIYVTQLLPKHRD